MFMKSGSIKKLNRCKIIYCALGLTIGVEFFSVASAAEIQYHSGDRRDPFTPLVDASGKVASSPVHSKDVFKVEGIIFDPIEGSYALINGKFYKEGDTIENANLISILKDRVVLSVNDMEKVIWLREEVVGK